VASGEALVTVANRELCLGPRGYVDIPAGVIHRLENRSDEPLRVVEVQVGDYLGEDDIERLDDEYGRVEAPAFSAGPATFRATKG
jgi:mannose-6-phosphate isomerase-like protein (cupin superfamily)